MEYRESKIVSPAEQTYLDFAKPSTRRVPLLWFTVVCFSHSSFIFIVCDCFNNHLPYYSNMEKSLEQNLVSTSALKMCREVRLHCICLFCSASFLGQLLLFLLLLLCACVLSLTRLHQDSGQLCTGRIR